MLWQNDKSVIVGRYQNTLAEINREFIEREHIVVARRLTGGGAVYHDLGNLNFTFIQNINPQDREINFVKFLKPILTALQALGLPAAFSGRNDLTVHNRKISGNAMAFHKNRVLEHGTLLFSTPKQDLSQALKTDPDKFIDKAVKSVQSRVTNISEHLSRSMSVLEFKDYLMDFMIQLQPGSTVESLTQEEEAAVQQLMHDKYSTWAWNFGNSPQYALKRKIRTRGGTIEVTMEVTRGHIEKVRFYGDFFSRREPEKLASLLIGVPHEATSITNALDIVSIDDYFNGATCEELISLLI